MSFQLSIQFLKSDLERVENQEYFMKDFQFADMIKFFSQIGSMKQINEKKQSINLFYDRFLALKSMYRSFYVQLKWIAVMHQIIQRFKENTPLYGYTLKALQICLEVIIKSQKQQGPYEKYLITNLVKPYLQYLSKLCLLNMPEQTAKYDSNSALNIFGKSQQGQDQNQDSTNHESQAIQQQNHTTIILIDWYRKYNFISGTLETFQTILTETHRFFNSAFPYLTNIGRFMNQDLNALIFKLKYMYRSLKKSNVTIIELDQLQIKLKVFTNKCVNYEQQNIFETSSKIEQFQKKDLQQFLESPLKPSQLKLFTKKSVGTPSSIFNKF